MILIQFISYHLSFFFFNEWIPKPSSSLSTNHLLPPKIFSLAPLNSTPLSPVHPICFFIIFTATEARPIEWVDWPKLKDWYSKATFSHIFVPSSLKTYRFPSSLLHYPTLPSSTRKEFQSTGMHKRNTEKIRSFVTLTYRCALFAATNQLNL